MPATVFPVACTPSHVSDCFVGVGDALTALSAYSGKTVQQIFDTYARTAQGDLEKASGVPFFSTRYCTRELARQLSLTLGETGAAGYDRMEPPYDYDYYAWSSQSGRLDLNWGYVNQVDLVRFSTAANGQMWDLPAEWINRDDETAALHFMPNAGGSQTIMTRIAGIWPYMRSAQAFVPKIIHVRYAAGMVQQPYDALADYDPEAAIQQTDWDPDGVLAYQVAIGQYAGGSILSRLGNYIDQGGRNVSFDGLSMAADPTTLFKRAKMFQDQALAFAQSLRERVRGPLVA